ncbi:transposase [Ruminococcaceae bacterium BL-6]|nr:transposase [Ruminococcaceae bacterium BL-6]CAB1242693.1 transposase [Ruminococcaceae bacterium BL-6]CAB1242972.1 transposase [Ruminococcaceae bacterium BL-6]CAB1245369.1 transposase [Ruminococcaceae bacterium BL-6]CAB1245670.1 transposase [Ruminococcaceae bacterium BL-6]
MKKDEKRRQGYPSDLTDKQWAEIEPLYSGLREYKWSKRELTDAVLYFVKTGCQWRHLPHDFPPYSTVHSFYRRARISGLWNRILQHMVVKTREDAGRKAEPSYGIIDSQSVKTVAASEKRGIDGGKKRKDASGTSS